MNVQVLLGVFFEALFFACLLILNVEERNQFPVAAHRAEFCVCHVRRDLVPARARVGRALGGVVLIMIGGSTNQLQ